MRYLKKDGLLPCISAQLHEQVIDIVSIEAAGLDAINDLVQLGEVFDLQRHLVLVLVFFGDAGQFTVDGRFVTPKSVTATSASGRDQSGK